MGDIANPLVPDVSWELIEKLLQTIPALTKGGRLRLSNRGALKGAGAAGGACTRSSIRRRITRFSRLAACCERIVSKKSVEDIRY